MKKILSKTLMVFIAGFCVFAFTFHRHQVRQVQRAVNEHAKIIAGSLWDINPGGAEEYLRAVAAGNHYERIQVKDADGNLFIQVEQPAGNLFENKLIELKLIPRVPVSADIFYQRERIGKVAALWRDTSIYVYAYGFLVGLLLFAVVLLYSRILGAKATLEQKVTERTLTLTERTDALQKSEQKIRAIFNHTLQFIGLLDKDGMILEANQAGLRAWGAEASDVIGKPFWEAPWFRNTPGLSQEIRQCVQTAAQGNIVRREIKHVTDHGKPIHVDFSIKPIFDKDGRVVMLIPEGRDISELKTAYDAVRKNEKSYRTLAENLPGLVYRMFLKENNRMQFFNSMIEPMTGYREADFANGTITSIKSGVVPEDNDRILSAVAKAIKEKKPIDVEYRFQHQSGEIRYFHERGKPVFDEDDTPLYIDGVIFDITADREALQKQQILEEQLRQAQKLEALGALAGGITHDFNNILSAIYGYTQLALMSVPEGSPAKTYLNNMFEAGNRARELVKQILTFSRHEAQKQFPVEARVIVKEALKLLRASIPATIEIRQNIAPNCGNVLANPTQIHQIMMNLCINAYHSMRETGGTLSVSLTPIDMAGDGDASGLSGLRPGPYLRLEVSDTGHGMDRKTMERIFEPYFTTKARGEGTGMGLSVVHGIVKSHGGHITVSSEPGKGSIFRIYWPVIEQSAIRGESVFGESLPAGNETILLVDDEEQTLHVEEAILKNLGYHIQAFTSPLSALERFRNQPGAFDLIVTDMTMPVMTGDKLSREILKIRPDMPIILCTGYSETITEEKAKAIGIREFILKPIEIKKFAGLLRKLLDKSGSAT